MAFSYSVTGFDVDCDKLVVRGTFTNSDGGTGGEIVTGLNVVENFEIQESGSAVITDKSAVTETLPFVGSSVTVVTTANADGYWTAWGI